MRISVLLAACVWTLGSAGVADAKESVAVVVVGKSYEDAAKLQRQLEEGLSAAGIAVMPAAHVAARLDHTGKRSVERSAEMASSMKEAKKSYYVGDIEGAVKQFRVIEPILVAKPPLGELEASYHLLKMAVHFDANRKREAEAEARKVLHFDPGFDPDPRIYRPAIDQFLSSVRKDIPLVEVTVNVVPTGSGFVTIDGREVAQTVKVTPGEYEITAYADGYRQVTQKETIDEDTTTIEIRMPFAVKKDLRLPIERLCDRKRKQINDDKYRVYALFGKTGPKVMVLGDAKAGRVAVYRPREGKSVAAPPDADIVPWVVENVSDAFTFKNSFLGLRDTRPGWSFIAGAALGFVVKQQTLDAGEAAPSINDMLSSGGSVSAVGQARRLIGQGYFAGDLELGLRSAQLGGGRITDPITQEDAFLKGGTAFNTRLALGYDRRLANGRLGIVGQVLMVGGMYSNSSDVYGFFTDHARVGAGVRISASYDLASWLRIEGGLEYVPVHFGSERGSLSVGESISPTTSDQRQWVAMLWTLPQEYDIGIRIVQDRLNVAYRGSGNSRLSPTPLNSKRLDIDTDTTFFVGKRF